MLDHNKMDYVSASGSSLVHKIRTHNIVPFHSLVFPL